MGVVAVFVFAAKDKVNIRWKGLQCLDGGVHVCSFGVVVVFHSAHCGYIFNSVFNRFEIAHCLTNAVRCAVEQPADAYSSQDVLHVVRTFEWDLRHKHHFLLAARVAIQNAAIENISTPAHFLFAAKPDDLSFCTQGHLDARGIISIQN